jgi:hypothetical protein
MGETGIDGIIFQHSPEQAPESEQSMQLAVAALVTHGKNFHIRGQVNSSHTHGDHVNVLNSFR